MGTAGARRAPGTNAEGTWTIQATTGLPQWRDADMSGDCEKFAVDLSAYFDDELSAEEAAVVKAHVDGCQRCRADLDKMKGLRSALNSSGGAPVPEQRLIQDLMRALRQPDGQGGADVFGSGRRGPSPTRGS
jgi:hypothetical protein